MLHGQKVVVVMPAYKAEQTLERTLDDMWRDVVDEVILVDDASSDATALLAKKLGLHVFVQTRISATARTRKRATAKP